MTTKIVFLSFLIKRGISAYKTNLWAWFYCVTFLLSACADNKKVFPTDYLFGTIQTCSSSINKSVIHFYDSNFQEVYTLNYKMGGMSLGFSPAYKVYDNKLYMPTAGTFRKGFEKILELDLRTGVNRFLENIGAGIFTVCRDENYLYSSYAPLTGSLIPKFDLIKNKIDTVFELKGYTINMLRVKDERLYVFSKYDDNGIFYRAARSYLWILDKRNFQTIKKIDITLGESHEDALFIGKKLYFTHWGMPPVNQTDRYVGGNILSELDIDTYELKHHILATEFSYQIEKYKNYLIISHIDPHDQEERDLKALTFFDLNTKKQVVFELKNRPMQIAVQGDHLYSKSTYLLDIYNLSSGLKYLNSFSILNKDDEPKFFGKFDNYSYISTFFLNPAKD
jgi:hypothetical protein